MDQGLTNSSASTVVVGHAGDDLQVRLIQLVGESSGLSWPGDEWRAAVALELVEQVLDPEQSELRLGDAQGVQALNLALYRMSYEAALICEHARQLGTVYRSAAPSVHSVSAPGNPPSMAETLRERLSYARAARGEDSSVETMETVGQLAGVLCLGLIDAFEARDRYDYAEMLEAVDRCDDCLPSGCALKSLRVFECLRAIALSGLSRDPGGDPPSRRDLEALARVISEDRDQGGGPYADYSLLLLVVAVGHAQRQDLVDNAARGMQTATHDEDALSQETDKDTSLVAWVLEVLQGMEQRGVADTWGWPVSEQPNPIVHHLHYYRHFAHHVRAIALANELKRAAASQAEHHKVLTVSDVKREYSKASVSLGRALQLVPPANEARWRYYDLNAENLEHEANLRVELLEQRLSTRQTIESLTEATVARFSDSAQEELRKSMADVSMRIVEVIGVFLAVVAILGVTIASATVDGLSLAGRVLLLAIGGTMPVAYFGLLRWIVNGRSSQQRTSKRGSA